MPENRQSKSFPIKPREARRRFRQAAISALAVVLGQPAWLPAAAQNTEYIVKGKTVSKEVYRAVMLLNEAIPLINAHELPQAIEKLKQAAALRPEVPEIQYNLGLCLARAGKTDEAIEHLKAVVDSRAELPSAWITLAGVYQNQGKFEDAVALYKDAMASFPEKTWETLPEMHFNYGLALAKLGKTDEAIAQMKLAAPSKANLPGTWLTLGALYQASGRLQESIDAYKEFLRRFPDNKEAPRISGAVKLLEKEEQRLAAGRGPHGSGLGAAAGDYFSQVAQTGARHWPASAMPLHVYMVPANGVKGFKPYYDDIFKQCFDEWVSASSGKISIEYVTEPSKAQIEFCWGDDPAKLANRAEGGEARIFVRPDSTIVKANITVLTVPVTPLRPVTDNLIRFTCLHEIGHALGMSGHSLTPGDIMFFSSTITDERRSLSQRDMKTLERLYAGNQPEPPAGE